MKRMIAIAALLFAAACTDAEEAVDALDTLGMTEIEITGYRWFGCGKEWFHTGFVAINPKGKRISGVVCAGWLKGATVRFD